MRAGLSLMKIALAPLGLTEAVLAINIAIPKKNLCIKDDYTDNLKRRNQRYHENS